MFYTATHALTLAAGLFFLGACQWGSPVVVMVMVVSVGSNVVPVWRCPVLNWNSACTRRGWIAFFFIRGLGFILPEDRISGFLLKNYYIKRPMPVIQAGIIYMKDHGSAYPHHPTRL
ncbi:hypothetical protein K3G39_19300 [Pontibacter sp. HSC-14F20]|uniref:hypothetical protein n=1 Tax=Pontibacter sp. HSC-14F20 TaxID=2864136 RepID=UPI001C736F1A|nr:hypothetical protein [Pontibacter sp. HSC-14F20]MBX0335387.1 hypothetical protein [Pontibacter sp. HSC-14F20]